MARPKSKTIKICAVPNCSRTYRARGFCATHLARLNKGLDVLEPIRVTSNSWVSENGYQCIYIPGHSESMKNGCCLKHRVVMSDFLGRPLEKFETVHHINGDRLDNRIQNLELWSRSQPYGQRVKDKVEWAKEILNMYDREKELITSVEYLI